MLISIDDDDGCPPVFLTSLPSIPEIICWTLAEPSVADEESVDDLTATSPLGPAAVSHLFRRGSSDDDGSLLQTSLASHSDPCQLTLPEVDAPKEDDFVLVEETIPVSSLPGYTICLQRRFWP